ncbi:small-conductance mechanosensitive channel [Paraburkholderia sp. 35.1]
MNWTRCEGFSRDLEKLRESAERAEERLRASEKRALLEIDRERGAAAKLQKDLDAAVKRADSRGADHHRAVEALQAQLGDVRHQAGVLQGRLDAVLATNVTLQQQLAALRQADTRDARPARAKSASTPARPVATRPSRAPRVTPAARHARASQQDRSAPQAGKEGWKIEPARARDGRPRSVRRSAR